MGFREATRMIFNKDYNKRTQLNTNLKDGQHRWHQPIDTSENIDGINDSSLNTFRGDKYEGLAREVLQNSLDEQLDKDKPVRVDFSLIEINTRNLPDLDNYKKMFREGLESWKDDSQSNARVFFEEALRTLSKEKIKIMKISDFNTNGVLGSRKLDIRSAYDITPWHNLLKSEGSSSKGDTEGGSFGIGKNATFANSILRTVFYSTFDRENVKGYEGVAKLATIFKNNKRYSSKCYYGEIVDDKSRAIDDLFSLEDFEQRTDYGTDIFILGFEDDKFCDIRIIKTILSDFIIPIFRNDLEVNINGEIINQSTIHSLYTKYIELCIKERRKSYANEIQSSKNYYEVLVSKDAQDFTTNIKGLGNATLKVLYHPDFERKVLRTRQTGMKLFDEGGISSSIGFSGIVTLEGSELNKLFRDMENPAHTKWSTDQISDPKRKKVAEDARRELNGWIRETILTNATDKETDSIEVEGLDEYLPAELVANDEVQDKEESDIITSKISEVEIKKPSREEVKEKLYSRGETKTIGSIAENGDPGAEYGYGDGENKGNGGKRNTKDSGIGEGKNVVFEKIKSNTYTPRLFEHEGVYILNINFYQNIENMMLKAFISGESTNITTRINYAINTKTNEEYACSKNKITIGNVQKGESLQIKFELEGIKGLALEVDIYESK